EICYSKSGGERYVKAEENAVQLVAYLLKKYKLPISRVKQHNFWSGKDCPHRIRKEGR
ncbi:MAG TPA: N-acetylmuramoyl-L-alanine amidase, partial [Firmicutes bacterium]|nr:N-acetylmuramoyl-L-alanine amidase [Bacillota bacterium]